MHSKVREWIEHPVSQVMIKVLQRMESDALDKALSNTEDRDAMLERIRVIREILEFDSLMMGELEENEDA